MPNQPWPDWLIFANNNKPVRVKILGEDDAVLFAETIEATGGFSKTYDLSGLKAKAYSFLVNSDKEISKRMTIQ